MMPCPERVWLVIDTIDAGVWCCQRRLHRGHFTWPTSTERSVSLSVSQWHWLITGVDWQRLDAPAPAHWRV